MAKFALGLAVALALVRAGTALDAGCYAPGTVTACPADAAESPRTLARCTLLCGVCTTPDTRLLMAHAGTDGLCAQDWDFDQDEALAASSKALLDLGSELHGYYWLDEDGGSEANATQCVEFLLGTMPVRDQQVLFSGQLYETLDWLFEHVRLALLTRSSWAAARAVPFEVFLEHVLPYAALDEKRDMQWRSRPRMYQLFFANASAQASLYDAAQVLSDMIPSAQLLGTLAVDDVADSGISITWKSSTAPAYMSPQQVATTGASCTGTALVMLAAFRSVGIPTRIAGCSDEFKNGAWLGDDHHWCEFYDPTVEGPFGDEWHTKEGTSNGNAGGPWDSPSSPMNGCLQGVVAGSSMATMWASSWSSPTFLPTLWHNSSFAETWAFVGGENRCGAYCQAWGCGANQTDFYTQDECAPVA